MIFILKDKLALCTVPFNFIWIHLYSFYITLQYNYKSIDKMFML